MKHTQRYRG